MTIELGRKKVGITGGRAKLFEEFARQCPPAFRRCVSGDFCILSPCKAALARGGQHPDYFNEYLDAIWDKYAREQPMPSGKCKGKVVDGALTYTPVAGGSSFKCPVKPSTQAIILCDPPLGSNPQFAAAFNRHVAADPADWNDVAKFYAKEPSNWYSKFFHERAIDHKAFGFCYDDMADQSSLLSGQGDSVTVTLYWD